MKLGKKILFSKTFCRFSLSRFFFPLSLSLELNMELPNNPQGTSLGASTQVSQEQDELTQRLARLRQAE